MSSCFLMTACHPTTTSPKPSGYFRIDLPKEHSYQTFDSIGFPFTFRYPVYAEITQDNELIKEENQPYWIDVSFPKLNAKIYLSYKKITSKEPLDKLVDESYKLSFSNYVKADYIHTPVIQTKSGLQGIYYYVGGDAATSYQFFVTDTVHNFIRGSLYFNVSPNVDSLKPTLQFIKIDLDTLIQSLRFNKN